MGGVIAAAIVAIVAAAHADDAAPFVVGGCKLATVGTGLVDAVIDGRTIMLAGGREVRLGGIEIEPAPAAGARSKLALETAVAGQAIVLRNISAETDRYGRTAAQVFVAVERAEHWVQADMVARGEARVGARVGDRACAAELLARERIARDAKLGLWAEPYYVVRSADDPAAILAERGRFAIVEGKVLTVRDSGATTYVNFGRRWSESFAVTILKRNERSFAAAGLEPKRLEGHRIRVRGFVEERGSPWIEATRPEQIEIVDRN